jgi:F420-non-reducing hydrogenase small subunit
VELIKKMAKLSFAFMQLSSCWGCHQSLLNAHLKLYMLIPEFDIVYWPAVVDFKLKSLEERADGSVDVGFIEGGVRTEGDKEMVHLIRKKCKIVVAFGACANHGSVIGLANLYTKEDLLKRKFVEAESIVESEVPGGWPNEYVPEMLDKLLTVPQVIDVEAKIPGCPPTTDNIVAAFAYMLTVFGHTNPKQKSDTNVCAQCSLNKGGCRLDAGEICYGAITAGGCELMCPESGDPCVGCFEVSKKIDGKRATQLFDLVTSKGEFGEIDTINAQKFVELYLGLGNFDFLYVERDVLQRLAEHPERFEEKTIKTKQGEEKVLLFNETGNETIDNLVGMLLTKLRGNKHFKFSQASVCSTCERTIVDKTYTTIKRDYEGMPNKEKCFLEEGYVCLGPVTKAGCGTICPNNANAPCLGCYGPPESVKDQGAKMLATYASLSRTDPDELTAKILDPAGLFNRFTLAASTFGGRVEDTTEEKK